MVPGGASLPEDQLGFGGGEDEGLEGYHSVND